MNRILLFLLLPLLSCQSPAENSIEAVEEKSVQKVIEYTPVSHLEWTKNAVIYEVNIRQYTEEGTFKAFQKHLPRLKEMGIDILWLMPIHPIGEKNRKGNVGSYYSVKDYKAVNPDYGTLEDFKNLITEVHNLGMKVIIDWVANHSSWDNVWVMSNPEFYTKDSLGNMMAPVEDWSDVADLNYDVPEMQDAMIDALKYWVTETDIDGYRCDVAMMVPTEFWNKARYQLDQIKPMFMLAEAEQEDHHEFAFDMSYGWEFHHIIMEISKGEKTLGDLRAYFTKEQHRFQENDYRMFFTTNHDENSWKGTEKELFGDNSFVYAVLAFTFDGMPLLYSGQEGLLDKQLKFFEKDKIDWSKYERQEFFTKLIKLKHENQALWNGSYGGKLTEIQTEFKDELLVFSRERENNKVIVALNISDIERTILVDEISEMKEIFGNDNSSSKLNLPPHSYRVFVK